MTIMAKKEMMMDEEHSGMHKKMMKMIGCKMLVLGILVLGNVYWPMLTWPAFIGWVLVVAGISKLAFPYCCKHHRRR